MLHVRHAYEQISVTYRPEDDVEVSNLGYAYTVPDEFLTG